MISFSLSSDQGLLGSNALRSWSCHGCACVGRLFFGARHHLPNIAVVVRLREHLSLVVPCLVFHLTQSVYHALVLRVLRVTCAGFKRRWRQGKLMTLDFVRRLNGVDCRLHTWTYLSSLVCNQGSSVFLLRFDFSGSDCLLQGPQSLQD